MKLNCTADFSLKDTFECGQAFRFSPAGKGLYRGVYKGAVLTFHETADGLEVQQLGHDLDERAIRDFLDLDRDYVGLQNELIRIEPRMAEAVEVGRGIHLLRQEPFEALVSFILSSNSNIQKIRSSVDKLCANYGSLVAKSGGVNYYAFPTLEQLKAVSEQDYRALGFGYRAGYVDSLVKSFEDQSEILDMALLPMDALLERLIALKGVGRKVASCVMLFGFGRWEAFPIDIWIKRYFQWELGYEGWTLPRMETDARERFGALSGLAQQYMFYFMLNKYKTLK